MSFNFKEQINQDSGWKDIDPDAKYICSFCHYDGGKIIADYVVHYLQSLRDAGSDIIFVSNTDELPESELAKIDGIVNQSIVRQNIGYDFAAYFTGYELFRDRLANYEKLLIVNDSAFGPFSSLTPTFNQLFADPADMYAISDAYAGTYHLQSYFWAFPTSGEAIRILDDEHKNFEVVSPKQFVVARYEEGISQRFLKEGLETQVLCKNDEAAAFERAEDLSDEQLKQVKADILDYVKKAKIGFGKKLKAIFSGKARQRNKDIIDAHAYLTGVYSCWYTMIKYFDCPFIKVAMLKNEKTFPYHKNTYIDLLKQKHPQFDINLIEDHLKRVRN